MTTTYIGTIADTVKKYATHLRDECGADDHLTLAVFDAVNDFEVADIGRAMLNRHNGLADASYRVGGENCDPQIEKLAELLTRW